MINRFKKNKHSCEGDTEDSNSAPIDSPLSFHRVKSKIRSNRVLRQLTRLDARSRTLIASMPDEIFVIDLEGHVIEVCEYSTVSNACRTCKIKQLSDFMPEHIVKKVLSLSLAAFQDRSVRTFEYECVDTRWNSFMEVRISVTSEGEILLLMRDISRRKRAEERAQYFACHDTLTGLENRVQFHEWLEQCMSARMDMPLAVIYINLDHFKHINAALSYQVGDSVLMEAADRLCALKDTLETNGISLEVARMGGDDLGILASGAEISERMGEVVCAINSVLRRPFSIEGHNIILTASMGVAISKSSSLDPRSLLGQAESALNTAKLSGGGGIHFFSNEYEPSVVKRFKLESRLRHAIRDGRLSLHYQPQKDIINDRFTGVEALLRWKDEELGYISPAKFIPIAEESSLILEIEEWVLYEACRQARKWQGRWESEVQVGINVSSAQLYSQDLAKRLPLVAQSCGVDVSTLEIELTESTMMRNSVSSVRALQKLKELGVSLAIDDFGTGYSSLSYLSRFPIDTLKIDRSFVTDFPLKTHDTAIVSAIIAMAEALSLNVIAEGVETVEQLNGLRACNCRAAQGFLLSHPMPVEDCTLLLDTCLGNSTAH